jgi:ribosomal protein S18 acetylase RimI-like enzyme
MYILTNLWVEADNDKAIHVYEKFGFEKAEPTMYKMEVKADEN